MWKIKVGNTVEDSELYQDNIKNVDCLKNLIDDMIEDELDTIIVEKY